MRTFTPLACAAALLTGLSLSSLAKAQFNARFRTNLRGDLLVVANSLVTCDRTQEAAATCDQVQSTTGVPVLSNDGLVNTWVDIDSDPATYNSSRAALALPASAGVEWAGLYWYGNRDEGGASQVPPDTRGQVKLAIPGSGSYLDLEATTVNDLGSTRYFAFAEVSDQVRAAGAGQYTVANVVANSGNDDHAAGWMMLVITRDEGESLRHFSIFDGREPYGAGATIDVALNGFLTPLVGPVEAEVLFVALDGDPGLAPNPVRSDSVEFTPEGGATTKLANALNDADDFGNSTISNLGAAVLSRTPAFRNTLGFDVDVFDVSPLVSNGASSATATFSGDGSETNDAVTAAFKTTIHSPQVDALKTLEDLNGGAIRPGDVLEYTVVVSNDAAALDDAVEVSLLDVIPSNATYLPQSTTLLTSPPGGPSVGALSDEAGDDVASFSGGTLRVNLGAGATAASPGRLDIGQSTSLSFRVVVGTEAAGEWVRNQAEVSYEGETLALNNQRFPAVARSHPAQGAGPTTAAATSADDGLPDDNDPDDDNDGLLDRDESPGFPGDPGSDADADGVPAWKDPDEVPGGCPSDGSQPARCLTLPRSIDADGDGVPNHLDRDTDGDGIPDTVESGAAEDADADGVVDSQIDSDGDGLLDPFDADPFDANNVTSTLTPRDTGDGDGLADFLDKDSDGDGLTDAHEAGYLDQDGDGTPDAAVDADGDGLLDSPRVPRNTDAALDALPDFADRDSDGDGVSDNVEAFDSDGDAALGPGEAAPLGNDADADGIDDQYDPDCPAAAGCAGGSVQVDATALPPAGDENADGTPDWLQVCLDGYVTGVEACDDGNGVDTDACSNTCLRGLSESCSDSAQCASGACHDDTGLCALCTDDATGSADTGCAGSTPACTEANGAGVCAVCEDDQAGSGVDDGCAAPTPVCNETSGSCVACVDTVGDGPDPGCSQAAPNCDAASGTCQECEDTDPGTELSNVDSGCGQAPFCDAETRRCLACLVDAHCAAEQVCNGGACVQCVREGAAPDVGCGAEAPWCDTATDKAGQCVQCLSNDNCAAGEYCTGTGGCAEGCDSDDDCPAGACDEASESCVPCIDSTAAGAPDEGCSEAAPVCLAAPTSGSPGTACGQCASDSACTGVCDTKRALCVTCTDSGSGRDAGCSEAAPNCDTTLPGGQCCDAEGVCSGGPDADADADGDGLSDSHECPQPEACRDTDGDGTPDVRDPDDDGDGLPTRQEQPDENGDGDPQDARDTDGDGTPDFLDPDDDGDGLPTSQEQPDENNNGAPEDARDSDGDGTPDFLDPDDDGDGLPTSQEQPDENNDGAPEDARDTDGDGTPDFLDPDDDGDGLPTRQEQPDENGDGTPEDARDSDGDGTPDFLDPDDDGDGRPTRQELRDSDGNSVSDHLEARLQGSYRGGAGCSVSQSQSSVSQTRGPLGLGPVALGLALCLGWRRRRSRRNAR